MLYDVLGRVFRHARYVVGASGVSLLALSAALLLPNLSAIKQVLISDSVGIGAKSKFVFTLYVSIFTNYTVTSSILLLVTVVLFGVNIALLTFYIRRRQELSKNTKLHVANIGGAVSAILGIGCAACGSVVLTATLGIFGAGGLLLLLPFHGAEFAILGVILLVSSILYLTKRINDPLVCPLKN